MAKRKRSAQQAKSGAASTTKTTPAATTQTAATAAATAAGAPPSRKEQLRAAAAAKRRRQTLLLSGAGVAVVLLVLVLVGVGWARTRPLVGEQLFPSQGNLHIALGSVSPVTYNSTPPTSGPHYENLAAWGIQMEPVRYEHLIHNLEDGGVVIYYQCEDGCPALVAELEAVVEPLLATGRRVVLTRNDPTWILGAGYTPHQDMGAPIALAAWRRLLKLESVDAETIRTFVERYEGIDNHRPRG